MQYFRKHWPVLGLLFTGFVIALVAVPQLAHAQNRYEYSLNGRTIGTNPDLMSGPYGCDSGLLSERTGQPVCLGDEVATPDSLWRAHIARECGILRTVRGQTGLDSTCIGGFVAAGRNCPRNPSSCRYYRIIRPYDEREDWSVSVSRIHQLGDELWIARPSGPFWTLFARCHANQYTQYVRRNSRC